MKVKDIINRVLVMYHDEQFYRLKEDAYLRILDDAILQTILTRPDAHEKREVIRLQPGTRQRLPEGAFSLIDVYANKFYIPELDIYSDGKPVYQVSRKSLDYFMNWYTNTEQLNEIDEFVYDIRTPKDYWVNPPVGDRLPIYVEIGYSCECPQYASMEEDFEDVMNMEVPISIEFRNAIVDYMLYLCYSTDSTSQFDRTIADRYLQSFYQNLSQEYDSGLNATARIKEFTTRGIGVHENTTPTIEQVNEQ